nr:immunoglobulin heavy chain junction region [Mus musculus]
CARRMGYYDYDGSYFDYW